MKKWRSSLVTCPLASHHDEHQYGALCAQQIWTDTMARSYWSISLRPAEQGRDRRPAIVICPDDGRPKKRGKSLLFAITKQPEDALIRTYTENIIPWYRPANRHTLKVSILPFTACYRLKRNNHCQFLVSAIFSMHHITVSST